MMAATAGLPLPDSNSASSPGRPHPRPRSDILRFGVSRPTWIVKSESNVRKEKIMKPDPPCVICSGSGRIDCRHCQGRGRANHVNLVMLPKGEWPRWCKVCSGSGLDFCNRCLGTGEYRDSMGFHFMKMNTNSSQR